MVYAEPEHIGYQVQKGKSQKGNSSDEREEFCIKTKHIQQCIYQVAECQKHWYYFEVMEC